jgi:uncharacterized Zn finger protein
MAAKSKQQKVKPAHLHQPKITEAKIRKLATETSFDRGEQYYSRGAITGPTRQDNRIWAECYGSELYQVSAVLTQSNVTDLSCSCPYDWGGACKHEVALLLTYLHQPEAFHLIPPLRELLVNHSRDDLLTLLDRVLQQYPDLLTSLEIAAETSAPQASGKPIDTSAYRRQIQRTLRGDDMRTIAKALAPSLKMAEQLYNAGDSLNAGCFYQVLLDEITASYDGELQSIDYDGHVACFSQDAAAGLGNCLADAAIDSTTRQDWLNSLLEGVLADVNLGGIDFAYGASEAIIEFSTNDEWRVLEARIRQEIGRLTEQQWGRWGRDRLAGLIAERLQHVGQGKASDEAMLELSSPEQQIFILAKQGKYDVAIGMAKLHLQNLPGLVIQFADALVTAGEAKKALRYMTEEYNADARHSVCEWLAKYYREQGDAKSALKFEEAGFIQRPGLENYQRIQKLAEPLGSWPKVKLHLLKQLTEKKRWDLLVEIAIVEKDVDRALKLANNLSAYQQTPFKLKIAKISEPKAAIAIYEELVHIAIARKNRSAYQEATRYLQSIQKLQKLAKTSKDWKQYLQLIRDQYPSLRALHSELDRL